MSDLRRDMVKDTWVVVATDRALKPNDFPINKQEMQNTDLNNVICPFCEGNESFTPEEIACYRSNKTLPNSPGWHIRTIPNKFSAFELDGILKKEYSGIYSSLNGLGTHEVVIETPRHGIDLPAYSIRRIEMILTMLKSRYNELSKDERIKYVHIYKNRGLYAGASLGHSHSQIVGLPINPNKNKGLAGYFDKTGHCLVCDIIKQEIREQTRVVGETEHFVLVCPFAPRFSYETWILPRKHCAHFGEINEEEIAELAVVLRYFTRAMLKSLDDPSFNIVFVSSPVNIDCSSEAYHWYIEINPRLIVTAGLEIGTGYYVNPVAPEISAGILRESFWQEMQSQHPGIIR